MQRSISINDATFALEANDTTVWFQGNKLFGNMVPDLSDDWEGNRRRALLVLGKFTEARKLLRMKPGGVSFIDLNQTAELQDPYHTEALITSNPDHILHANPADCGELAVRGYGVYASKEVIALVHASRHMLDRGYHLQTLGYMSDTYGIRPEDLFVKVGPSARAESYKFAQLDEAQLRSKSWKEYIYQDDEGMWHVDFHGRTLQDLRKFGIPDKNISVSNIDTAADPTYFSNMRLNKGLESQKGGNGLMYSLR